MKPDLKNIHDSRAIRQAAAQMGATLTGTLERAYRNILRLPATILILTVLFASAAHSEEKNTTPKNDRGLPIFHFDENQWFELTIPNREHPDNAFDIQDQINRENAGKNAEREGKDPIFPDELDILNEIQLRYQLRFK